MRAVPRTRGARPVGPAQAENRVNAWRQWLRARVRAHPAVLFRRALASALFLVAVVLAAMPDAGGGELVDVVVTSRDLPLGASITMNDVEVVAVPAAMRPDGALGRMSDATGRHLVGSARAGEPVTDVRLAERRRNPPGTATVPVRLDDAEVAGLLRPGTRVDVVSPSMAGSHDGRTEQVLARGVTVVSVAGEDAAARDGPVVGGESGALVLLLAPVDTAARLAAVSLDHPVTVTLR